MYFHVHACVYKTRCSTLYRKEKLRQTCIFSPLETCTCRSIVADFSPPPPPPPHQATGSRLSSLIETVTALILAMIIAFVYSWIMALFMVSVVPILIIAGVFQGRILSRNIAQNKKALENAGMVAVDSIENIRTVALLGVEENFYSQYSNHIVSMYR